MEESSESRVQVSESVARFRLLVGSNLTQIVIRPAQFGHDRHLEPSRDRQASAEARKALLKIKHLQAFTICARSRRVWASKCNSTDNCAMKRADKFKNTKMLGERLEMRKQKGFSLIELLIVVAIILIIAAIAIPNLLRARMAANESAAASSIRTINTAEVSYLTAYPTTGFAALANLGGASPCTASSATACLIDNNLAVQGAAAPGKSGYIYTATAPTSSTYEASAYPTTLNSTGTKLFCSVEDAVVRVNTAGGTADPGHAGCAALPGIAN